MFGKTNEQIHSERVELISKLNNAGYDVIDSVINSNNDNPVWLLGESIKLLSEADYIYTMSGWESSRGCIIEKAVACFYNIPSLDGEML